MLMLIRFKNAAHSVWNRISIHLMLMLIWKALIFHQSKTNFNTSHVNVNPLNVISSTFYLSYFNTSHVNVNLKPKRKNRLITIISIHLMLMLIIDLLFLISSTTYFNTSHVNVNLASNMAGLESV